MGVLLALARLAWSNGGRRENWLIEKEEEEEKNRWRKVCDRVRDGYLALAGPRQGVKAWRAQSVSLMHTGRQRARLTAHEPDGCGNAVGNFELHHGIWHGLQK